MRRHELVYGLNAGGVDPEAIARVDLEKMRLAAEHPMANWLPRVLGPATLRPGLQSLFAIPSNDQTRVIKFQRSTGTSYILLLSDLEMRIVYNDAIVQVPAVSTAISSGSWTDVSTSGAGATGGSSLSFAATSTSSARLRQAVSVLTADQSKVNILRVVVSSGPVIMRIGTTSGGQELIEDAILDTGTHKIGFTPGAATVYVEIRADDPVARSVSSIQFESGLIGGTGDLVIPTPWDWAAVQRLRTWQSIDSMFVGDGTYQQREIQHRGVYSWGLALLKSNDGPFIPGTTRITMTPSGRTGNISITASEAYFRVGHIGSLIELTQAGKTVTRTFTASTQTSDYITVIGAGVGRRFYITGTGSSFVGTIVLERSFDPDEPVAWTTLNTYTDGAATFARTDITDSLDNLTVHYRFRCSAYTSGSVDVLVEYESGIQVGRARIMGYTSPTVVDVETIRNFGNTSLTRSWRVGDWSDLRGWPRVPVIHDARLHWFREDDDFASLPDDYTNYDDEEIGDSAPFTRSVGSGGSDGVLWALSLGKLLVGTASAEAVIAASELDEPLTPTKYTVRKSSRRGCADIEAVEHDDGAFFVQRSSRRLYEIGPGEAGRFRSQDVSRLNPAAFSVGITKLAVQQQPDTRCYCLLSDGTVVILTYERDDKVVAVTTMTTFGTVEDICVLPGSLQDNVYMIVNRLGARYLEKLAREADQTSVSTCALLDGHKVLTGPISSITGATHLVGQTVHVWADGALLGTVTINGSGAAALGGTYSRVVYGFNYDATFKSVKLSYAAGLGTAIGQTKIVKGAGLVLANSCLDGIYIGRDASNLDPMPEVINGAVRSPSQFFAHYDADIFPINSDWDADARFYLKTSSAYGPVTIQAVVLDVETRDGASSRNG